MLDCFTVDVHTFSASPCAYTRSKTQVMSVFQTALALFGAPIIHLRTFLTFEINDQRAVPKRSLSAPPKIFQTASEKVVRRTKKKKVKTRQRVNDDLVLTEAKQLAIEEKWQRLADVFREKHDLAIRDQLLTRMPQFRVSLSIGGLKKVTECLNYNTTDLFLMFTKRFFRYVGDPDKVEIWCSDHQLTEERFQDLHRTANHCKNVIFIDVQPLGMLVLFPYRPPVKTDALRRKVMYVLGQPSGSMNVAFQKAGEGLPRIITEDLVSVGDTLIAIVS